MTCDTLFRCRETPHADVLNQDTAGGAQNSGALARCRDASPSICPVRGVRFHCTKAPRGIVARILLVPRGTRDATAAMENRQSLRAWRGALTARDVGRISPTDSESERRALASGTGGCVTTAARSGRVAARHRTPVLGFQHVAVHGVSAVGVGEPGSLFRAGLSTFRRCPGDFLLCRQATSLVMVEVGPKAEGGRVGR